MNINRYLLISLAVLFGFFGFTQTTGADFSDLINDYNVYSEPNLSKPDYLQPYTDPVFGTKITRITDVAIQPPARHHWYSLQNPWNADDSYLLLVDSNNWYLYDGKNYQYIKTLNMPWGGITQSPIWHPTDPKYIYYTYQNKVRRLDVTANINTDVRTFTAYNYVTTTPYGTTMSDDGKILLIGLTGTSLYSDFKDAFVYNVLTDTVGIAIDQSGCTTTNGYGGIGFAGIAHSGNYAIISYRLGWQGGSTVCKGVHSFTVDSNLNLANDLKIFNTDQHGDIAIDADGTDVVVYSTIDGNHDWRKYRLSDGAMTVVHTGLPWPSRSHTSGRCTKNPGWVIASTYSDNDGVADPWSVWEDEIFAIKLDGSLESRRIASHHSQVYLPAPLTTELSFWAQPHASTNKDCSKIIFGSNWRDTSNNGDNVDVYVVDLNSSSNTIPPATPSGLSVN